MIQSVGSSSQINGIQYSKPSGSTGSLMDFSVEDEAIISAQAKMLNELDRFNSGEGNEIDLALSTITGKTQVEAAVRVIDTKKEMMDAVMEIAD